jgi:4-aminobutyrate aminotransferase-like enzyme
MSQATTHPTVAAGFFNSEAVEDAIDTIVRELTEAQASIRGVRKPTAELAVTMKDHLDRRAAVIGKPALYPYFGSAIGNGTLVELVDGSVKYDMINGIGVHMFGHSDPDMVATAVRAALSDVVMQGNLQFNVDSLEFGELVVEQASRTSKLKHCFLTNSGCMANEAALKVVYQKHVAAPRVIAFKDCFMGRSTTMAQIGDGPAYRVGIPLNVLVDYMPFYDPDQGERSVEDACRHLQQYIDRYPGQHAAFIFELVQGEGGFNLAEKPFHEALMQLCKSNNIAVWIDEVQTFGRTEQMFHFEQMGLGSYADVVTFGKMSQICGCLFTEEYSPKPGLLSGTFIGSCVGLQVGKRALTRLRDEGHYGPQGKNAKLQQAFRQHAQKLVDKHPDWFLPIRDHGGKPRTKLGFYGGVGGMMRLTPFGGQKAKITKTLDAMFHEGVIAFYCGHDPYHIRFLPPVGVMKPEQFGEVFAIMETAMAKVAAAK